MGRIDKTDQATIRGASALRFQHDDIKKKLDELRRTRKARGGVGAPLQVPAHLRDAAAGIGIVVTDADLDPRKTKTREQELDEAADLATDINEVEEESEG